MSQLFECNIPTLNAKTLVAIPAVHRSHNQHLAKVEAAIFEAKKDASYDLFVAEPGSGGMGEVVDGYNRIVNLCLAGDYCCVWFVEADVEAPAHAYKKLLADGVDVAAAVVPYRQIADCYRDLMVAGYFTDGYKSRNLTRQEIINKQISGNVYAGSSCFLVKRRVFEDGVRFHFNPSGPSYDMVFWREVEQKGYSVVVDGNVLCRDLDEV